MLSTQVQIVMYICTISTGISVLLRVLLCRFGAGELRRAGPKFGFAYLGHVLFTVRRITCQVCRHLIQFEPWSEKRIVRCMALPDTIIRLRLSSTFPAQISTMWIVRNLRSENKMFAALQAYLCLH